MSDKNVSTSTKMTNPSARRGSSSNSQRCGKCWWIIVCSTALCILTTWMITGTEAKPAPIPPQELADALKVLQQLDRYYSQVARPR